MYWSSLRTFLSLAIYKVFRVTSFSEPTHTLSFIFHIPYFLLCIFIALRT